MFGKKSCSNCKEKVNKDYSFCPYCGYIFSKKARNEKDYGMLGADDEIPETREKQNPLDAMIGGIGGTILNKMFTNAVKMLEKELEKEMKNQQKNQNRQQSNNQNFQPRTNFEIIINGKRVNPENIKFTRKILQQGEEPENQARKKPIPKMSSESMKKMAKMKKKEPSTNIRRIANKVIYELNIPGVKSIEDISIIKLESSIEVKALAKDGKGGKKDKAYAKLIPINLPITNYELEDGKLILELDAKS